MKEITITSNVPIANTVEAGVVTAVTNKEVTANSIIKSQLTSIENYSFNLTALNYGEDTPRQPSLFKYSEDSFSKADTSFRAVGKNLIENLSNVELKSFNIGSGVVDTLNGFQTLSIALSTNYTDNIGYLDNFSASYEKWWGDNLIPFESKSFSLETVKSDLQYASEILFVKDIEVNLWDGEPSYALSDYFLQDYAFINMKLSDTTSFLWDIRPLFTDTLIATDDFYGSANIDDDQIAAVDKNIVEVLSQSEMATLQVSVVANENTSLLDLANNALDSLKLETIISSEISVLDFSRPFNEILSSVELTSKDSTTTTLENLLSTDLFNKISDLVKIENIISSDSIISVSDFGRSFNETLSNTGLTNKDITTYNLENITYIDLFNKTLNMVFNDTDTITDSATVVYGGAINDNLLSFGSGLINNQDYFLNDFARDDYAGTNTLF